MKTSFLVITLTLVACAHGATQPSPETPYLTSRSTQESGYVDEQGRWRPCDPIGETEKLYVNRPGWKNACREQDRIRALRSEAEDDSCGI